MKKIKGKKNIIAIIIIVAVLSTSFIAAFGEGLGDAISDAFGAVFGENRALEEINRPLENLAMDEDQLEEEMTQKIEEMAKDMEIPNDVSENLKSKKQPDKLEKGYKRIQVEKNLDEDQQETLDNYIIENEDTTTVYALYDFMHENFFTYADLDEALVQYNSGKSIGDILEEYSKKNSGYVPRSFADGTLDTLTKAHNISIDQIDIADVLAYRGIFDFDEIIDRLKGGGSWGNICADFGIIDTSGVMNVLNISDTEINECAQILNISEEEARDKVIEAKVAKVKTKDIPQYVRSDKKRGKALEEHYEEKYSG